MYLYYVISAVINVTKSSKQYGLFIYIFIYICKPLHIKGRDKVIKTSKGGLFQYINTPSCTGKWSKLLITIPYICSKIIRK